MPTGTPRCAKAVTSPATPASRNARNQASSAPARLLPTPSASSFKVQVTIIDVMRDESFALRFTFNGDIHGHFPPPANFFHPAPRLSFALDPARRADPDGQACPAIPRGISRL